ncbi:MAG: 5'-3' exonuclease H3TH domain-containing protein, partial [Microcystaceae cyanobacterium]
LLQEYPSLDAIYENLANIKGAVKKKLEEGRETAYHSQHLAQIILEVPLDIDLQDLQMQGFSFETLRPLLESLELRTFSEKFYQFHEAFSKKVLPPVATILEHSLTENSNPEQQLSLFAMGSSATDGPSSRTFAFNQSCIQPEIIDTTGKLTKLIHRLKERQTLGNLIAWDTETTGLDPLTARLVGIGCCWDKNSQDMAYIPLNHTQGHQLSQTQV